MADNNDDEWLYGASGEGEPLAPQDDSKQDEIEMLAASKNANINEKSFETFVDEHEHNFEVSFMLVF